MSTVRLGDPLDPSTDQGPLVSARQQQHVAGFVTRAIEAAAKVVRGGAIPSGTLETGFYYEPTLVVDALQCSEIVQNEIFEYTNVKHVMSDITGVARKDWQRGVFGDRD